MPNEGQFDRFKRKGELNGRTKIAVNAWVRAVEANVYSHKAPIQEVLNEIRSQAPNGTRLGSAVSLEVGRIIASLADVLRTHLDVSEKEWNEAVNEVLEGRDQ